MQNNSTCLQSLFSVFMHKQKRKTTSFKKTQKKKKLSLSLNAQSKRSISKKLTLVKSLRQTISPTTQVPNSVADHRQREKSKVCSEENKKNKGLNFHPRKISFNNTTSNKIVSQQVIPTHHIPTKKGADYLRIEPVRKQNSFQRTIFQKQLKIHERKQRVSSLNEEQRTKTPEKTDEYIARIERIIKDSKRLTAEYEKQEIQKNQKSPPNTVLLNQLYKNDTEEEKEKVPAPEPNQIPFPLSMQEDTLQNLNEIKSEKASIWEVLPEYKEDHEQKQLQEQIFVSQYKNKPHLGDGIMTIISKFDQSSKKSQHLQFSSIVFRMNGDNYRNTQFIDNSPILDSLQKRERNSLRNTDDPSFFNEYENLNKSDRPANFKKNKEQPEIVESEVREEQYSEIEISQQKTSFEQVYDAFQKVNYLGVGRFASVYLCRVTSLNFLFAMKQILHFTLQINNLQDQIMEQIRIQSLCSHPNVLSLYNVYRDKKKIYLALEYGEDTLLKKMQSLNEKRYKEQDCLKYLKQIAEGLRYLHERNIIHRDIKPENIIFVNGICKIGDFGWAVVKEEKVFDMCGTPCYISPQIQNNLPYTQKTDCWSLGVLAYEIINGKLQQEYFEGKQFRYDILKFDAFVSEEYKEILKKLLTVNEQDRISMQDLLKLPCFTGIN